MPSKRPCAQCARLRAALDEHLNATRGLDEYYHDDGAPFECWTHGEGKFATCPAKCCRKARQVRANAVAALKGERS